MKTVENLLVELQDELHYQQHPSEKKGKIFKEEHLKGDYFPLHMVKTVVERYISQLTPAPLSEQKQEGETAQQAGDKIASYIVERFSNGNVPLNLANLKHWFRSAAFYGIEWQSQNTAKQIDQYKARIMELEALLKNGRNVIAELNDGEMQFGIQLCNDIDAYFQNNINI